MYGLWWGTGALSRHLLANSHTFVLTGTALAGGSVHGCPHDTSFPPVTGLDRFTLVSLLKILPV